ncbi:Cdc6/Cdc18 family protein [Halopenitus sp. H-Gu1]|uniref:Cdc6/Cdc18 family protein n=1 Tax=Halopenitus sp. H-Gu1 TaxID=3242697 RepID=UPI00359EFC02
MDIDARIKRRQRREEGPRLVEDYEALSPVTHLDEPSHRGPVLERLLDHLDPVFDGRLPPNAYVHGPFGSGKTAIVTALLDHLDQLSSQARSVIYTSTRAGSPTTPGFAYVDLRETKSEFAFYHHVLDALADDPVPEHGVGTEEIRRRLHDRLGTSRAGVVVGVDHVGTPDSIDVDRLVDLFSGLPSNASWLAIGRAAPEETALSEYTATTIAVERYQRQMLVDVLMTRVSKGLTQQALTHDLARQIAEWADGNAHDALAALFVATDRANRADRGRLTEADVAAAMEAVPRPSVSLGRVLCLPENKQLVLRKLVDLDPADRDSVTATTKAISADPAVDLSAGTVKRYLYEMAEIGVVERVQSSTQAGKGRPPSRVELRFPPTVFRRLYDLRR